MPYRRKIGARLLKRIDTILKSNEKSGPFSGRFAAPRTQWELVQEISRLDPNLAAVTTLYDWIVGEKAEPHRIPAIALPLIARALRTDVARLIAKL